MSRLDVLAVMGRAHMAFSGPQAAEIYEARAAVAELVAGMRQVLIEATESPNSDANRIALIEELARAAIAKFGSAN